MQDDNVFAKKIRELTVDEIEYTEDFFEREFGTKQKTYDPDPVATLKKTARTSTPKHLTPDFRDDDIDDQWLDQESDYSGQLAVDVYETDTDIVIVSTVAGVRSEDIDIDMNGDMITIKGMRRAPHAEGTTEDQLFIQECFWGGFSRSIIMPVDIQHDLVTARLENGILTIILPKSKRSRNAKIEIQEL